MAHSGLLTDIDASFIVVYKSSFAKSTHALFPAGSYCPPSLSFCVKAATHRAVTNSKFTMILSQNEYISDCSGFQLLPPLSPCVSFSSVEVFVTPCDLM
jgi:hypothetical protein